MTGCLSFASVVVGSAVVVVGVLVVVFVFAVVSAWGDASP